MQFRRRPWLTLLAGLVSAGFAPCTLAQRATAPAAEEPAPPVLDAAATDAPAADTGSGRGSGLKWRIPPIGTSGSLAYDLRANHTPEGSAVQHLVTARFSAATYVYQPWFATMSGSLGLTMGRAQASGPENKSEDQFLTGSMRLDLFPRSRFPLGIHYEMSDSRVDSGLVSTIDYRAQTFGISQRFRPESGAYSFNTSFENRVQDGAGFHDIQNLLIGDFSTSWKHNNLSLGASESQGERKSTGDSTLFRSLVARHVYTPNGELSLNTSFNWTQTEDHTQQFHSNVSVLQGMSVGVWRTEGSRLTLSGSARGLMLRDAETGQEISSLGLTLGASYELNRNARLTANGGINAVQSGGTRSQSVLGSISASWQGDTLEWRGFRYDWFSSATLGGSKAGDGIESALGLQLGHTLSRAFTMSESSSLVFNAGQTYATTQSRGGHSESGAAPDQSQSLVHNAGATWNSSAGSSNAYARASFSDSRELGGGRSQFQMMNFQLSGIFEFSRYQTLSGDLTMQRIRQRGGDVVTPGPGGLRILGEPTGSSGVSGEIAFRQTRLFGVPRLRFVSRLKLAQDVLSQQGTLATVADRETRLWENRLEWSVGRLETHLVLRISESDGVRREFLMWRLQRGFGG